MANKFIVYILHLLSKMSKLFNQMNINLLKVYSVIEFWWVFVRVYKFSDLSPDNYLEFYCIYNSINHKK